MLEIEKDEIDVDDKKAEQVYSVLHSASEDVESEDVARDIEKLGKAVMTASD